MSDSANPHYTPLAKWLHWLIAALIVVQYLLIELAERAEHASQIVKQLGLIANHKSVGITILLIALVRLIYRVSSQQPALPKSMPSWQIKASNFSHTLLYLLLFSLPITGWLMSSASAYTVSWFNLFALPDFINPDEQAADLLATIHTRLADALMVIAALHIGAAIKHHFIDKDTVLIRMLSKGSLALAIMALVVSLIFLGGLRPNKPIHQNQASTSATSIPKAPEVSQAKDSKGIETQSDLPIWDIDYSKSHIKFTGEQAGAPFTGTWQQWEGKLQFNADNLEQSTFDVSIDISSVFSNDEERDSTMKSSEFFDVLQFPKARFQASDFIATAHGFTARGLLTIKSLSHPTELDFTIQQNAQKITLTGEATLERHQWNIGTGDWADPTWVGSTVDVDIVVEAFVF